MANFIIAIDPDATRLERFVADVEPRLCPVDGLRTETRRNGQLAVLWAAHASAPASIVSDSDGTAIVWGDAIPGPGPQRLDAQGLRQLWLGSIESVPAACDGFHAALVHHSERGLVVGADLLGLFPVYFCAVKDALLVASSPELFRYHPDFRMELNPRGLVGILLINGLVDGETLLKGVRRLSPGHLLVWRPGGPPVEHLQYQVPISDRNANLHPVEQVELLHGTLRDAVSRHAPSGRPHALLLSGGLDSRMLGGYMRPNHRDAIALTLGLATDFDAKCSKLVARALGFEQRLATNPYELYRLFAETDARWVHLAGGFTAVTRWGNPSYLGKIARPTVTGYVCGAVVGGIHIGSSYSEADHTFHFGGFFEHINRWGIPPPVLKKLLRPELFEADLVDQVMDRIRRIYESGAEFETQRAWCFDLHHSQRFQVGTTPWTLCFGGWPVLPAVDRSVLEVMGGMPPAAVADRRLQRDLICTCFPDLARLPADRAFNYPVPLEPGLIDEILAGIHAKLMPARRLLASVLPGRGFYQRTYDLNGPGWRRIRQAAEPLREVGYSLFRKEPFDSLLPPPEVRVPSEQWPVGHAGLRLLIGSMLWRKDHC